MARHKMRGVGKVQNEKAQHWFFVRPDKINYIIMATLGHKSHDQHNMRYPSSHL